MDGSGCDQTSNVMYQMEVLSRTYSRVFVNK